jgi:hypothetical protein
MSKKKQSALTKVNDHHEPQGFRVRDRDDGGFDQLTPPEEAAAAVKRMFGVSDTGSLGTRFLSQAVGVMKPLHGGTAQACDVNDAAELLECVAAQDTVEGMLAIQMLAAHSAAVRCLQAAMSDKQTFHGKEANINLAVKLMRTYTAQIEALNRHRSKARQTMIVKHVHVHEGGQAIVGNVDQGGGGEA